MKKYSRFKFFTFFLILVAVSFVSCKNSSSDDDYVPVVTVTPSAGTSSAGDVLVFYVPNGLGDNSSTDGICEGVHRAAIKHNLSVYDICPPNWASAENYAKQFIDIFSKNYKSGESPVIFIFTDSNYLSYIKDFDFLKTPREGVAFLLFDSKESSLENLSTVFMPLYGASYLAGVASKKLLEGTASPRVLAILANSVMPSLKDSLKGFVAGYEITWDETVYDFSADSNLTATDVETLTNKNFGVVRLSKGLDDKTDPYGFNSADKAYSVAQIFQNLDSSKKYNLYFPVCGGSVQGLIRYNREKKENSFYTVGMTTDLSIYTSQVPFSVIQKVDQAAENCVNQWVEGKLPHYQKLGLEEGYTSLEISKKYKEQLSEVVKNAFNTAVEKEQEYEKNK